MITLRPQNLMVACVANPDSHCHVDVGVDVDVDVDPFSLLAMSKAISEDPGSVASRGY